MVIIHHVNFYDAAARSVDDSLFDTYVSLNYTLH